MYILDAEKVDLGSPDSNQQRQQEPKPNPPAEREERKPTEICPKCGKVVDWFCPTFKMCDGCLISYDKWTIEELEFGIESYQKSIKEWERNNNQQAVENCKQKLKQIQAELKKKMGSGQEPKPNLGNREPHKPHTDENENNEYRCEGCGVSCWNENEENYNIRALWIRGFNLNKEFHYFSYNCSCAEEFKKNHQSTCKQCGKREWPDTAKGWALDHELKTIFCSPICYYKYYTMRNYFPLLKKLTILNF